MKPLAVGLLKSLGWIALPVLPGVFHFIVPERLGTLGASISPRPNTTNSFGNKVRAFELANNGTNTLYVALGYEERLSERHINYDFGG